MYQLEVKANLVRHAFPPKAGWEVWVDIDSMERCRGGSHPEDKLVRVRVAEQILLDLGANIRSHAAFNRADIVASHPQHGTVIVEVEGRSSRQREQAMYSALGQIVLSMRLSDRLTYALAVPDQPEWSRQLQKIPKDVSLLLNLRLYLVSADGVRELYENVSPQIGA